MPRDLSALSREWFTAAELAEMQLDGMPTTKRGINDLAEREGWRAPNAQGRSWRQREGRGGGIEYHVRCLPTLARACVVACLNALAATKPAEAPAGDDAWQWYERQPDSKKAKALARLATLGTVEDQVRTGTPRSVAMHLAAIHHQVALRTVWNWANLVAHLPREQWLPALCPRHAGGREDAACSPEAWDAIRADFLRPERPPFSDCYRRLAAVAAEQGWDIPAERTLFRRIMQIPEPQRVLLREGVDALRRTFPAQQRDRSVFHALEAVNADGHTLDVFVRWADGTVGRPNIVAFQDLYSGKILSWRLDRTLSWNTVRLAFGDVVETYGIPRACWLDNGREFAAKRITGGQPNRYRFKLREEEPEGLLTTLGVEVHWTTPYHGQAKPIERAFRDWATTIAKHPSFAGAYTGNSPTAKPSNYGAKAVPIDQLMAVLAAGVAEHNARPGRKSTTCAGRSFDATFDASYATAMIRRASPEQRRLWLLAAEAVSVRSQDGTIHFHGNRYWHEALLAHRGQKVIVRFDPDALAEPLHVYAADGRYLVAAECVEAVGFDSVDAARAQASNWKTYRRATREAAAAQSRMDLAEYARLLPKADPPAPPAPRLVQLVRGSTALKPAPAPEPEADGQERVLAALRAGRAERGGLRLIEALDEDEPE
jgi:putative transposase